MYHHHNTKLATEIFREVTARLQQDDLSPVPHNYELWYAYYANVNAELKKEINAILQGSAKLSEEQCLALHEKYLSEARHQLMVQRAGDQIHATLQDMSGLMNNVRSTTNEYNSTLLNMTTKLSGAKTPEQMSDIVRNVARETTRMMEQNRKLEEQLDQSSRAMDELKKDLEHIRREAMTDGLTGLSNRKSFDDQIRGFAIEAEKQGRAFTLLMIDIDHFKTFNDNFGHQVGDQVLRLVARTLVEGVKGRDISARYGGEEFAIILPDTNIDAGIMVGDNLRKSLANKEVVNRTTGEQLSKITMSVGVAQYYKGESIEELIERADAALYTAKHNGRNQVAAAPTPHERHTKKEAS